MSELRRANSSPRKRPTNGRSHAVKAQRVESPPRELARGSMRIAPSGSSSTGASLPAGVSSSWPGLGAPEFPSMVNDLARYVGELRKHAESIHPPSRRDWAAAAEGLHSAMEELIVAQEELIAARSDAETERARYHDLFDFAPDGYLVTNAKGVIAEANRAAVGLLNLPATYMVNKPLAVFVESADRSRFRQAVSALRSEERREWVSQLRPRGAAPILVQLTAAAVRDWDGALVSIRWLLRDVTAQKLVEDEISSSRRRLRSMASALSLAEERERRRIAVGLHDRVSQPLAMARITLGQIREFAGEKGVGPIQELSKLLGQATDESRTLTFELSPPVLYELGFVPALEWLGEQTERRHGIEVRVVGSAGIIGNDTRVLLFQAVRELLTNVVKHARAKVARVTVRRIGADLSVTVADDGVGFNSARIRADRPSGFGLFSLRTRLEQIGGRIRIESALKRGARITLIAPAADIADILLSREPEHEPPPVAESSTAGALAKSGLPAKEISS